MKPNEVREGGTGWNVLKYFTLFWTITVAAAGIAGMIGAGAMISETDDGFVQAGAVFGATLGMTMLFIIWFVVALIALILGLFLKKSSIVEKGPTGPLAQSQQEEGAVQA